jgi:hypothetical protein
MPAGGGGAGGGWNTTGTMANSTYHYYCPSGTTGTYTYGGNGTYTAVYNDWVYTTNNTVIAIAPYYTPEEPMVDQPWTEEYAIGAWLQTEQRDWLAAEREYVNGWLRAEDTWKTEEARRQRDAARVKAEALLLSLLPEPEVQRYRLEGWFEVIGSHGGHYRVHRGVAGNVYWSDDQGLEHSLCCHPATRTEHGQLPTEDVMVGQLLAIQTDEAGFVHTANGRKPPHLRPPRARFRDVLAV